MKDRLKYLIIYLGSKEFLLFLTLTLALYTFVEWAGLFRPDLASFREIFHSKPVKLLSIFIIINSLFGIAVSFRRCSGLLRAGTLFFFVGILILVAGLWISIYDRFEGDLVRAEKETFSAFRNDYIYKSLYNPKRDRLPQVGITFHKILPEASEDMRRIKKVSSDVTYAGSTTDGLIHKRISSDEFFISDWTYIRFTDFGYAPKIVFYDLNESELEYKYVYMKLFPSGEEDYTEAMFLGYLFYIRCYPDYVDNDGVPGTKSPYPVNPVFNLRIVRNKDIVFDELIRPDQKVRFDNQIVALPEVKMWVKMRFVRDMGLIVASGGIPFLMLGIAMMWIGRRNRS